MGKYDKHARLNNKITFHGGMPHKPIQPRAAWKVILLSGKRGRSQPTLSGTDRQAGQPSD